MLFRCSPIFQEEGKSPWTSPSQKDEAFMFSLCQLNKKAKCFSTRPRFAEKIARGERFKSSGHWEPAGHLTVAEAIQRYLVDEGYVPVP
jgi:hypothetical protein